MLVIPGTMMKMYMHVMNAYGTLTLLQVQLNIVGIHMMTDTMLAQHAGRSLATTPTCVDTLHAITLNFVISVADHLFQMKN